jgi:hypothetical protein
MPGEMADNIEFLARDGVIAAPGPPGMKDRLGLVADYLAGQAIPVAGTPLYRHVA